MLTKDSMDKLTSLLALPATGAEQDWEVELANPTRIDEFVAAYPLASLSSSDRFALMALILASVDEFLAEEDKLPGAWVRICEVLNKESSLHEPSVSYWCCEEEDDPDAWFHLTPHIREIGETRG